MIITLDSILSGFTKARLDDAAEGLLIFRFGDKDVCVAVLDAIDRVETILSDNYFTMKQFDRGLLSEEAASSLCSKIDPADKALILKHGARLLEIIGSMGLQEA